MDKINFTLDLGSLLLSMLAALLACISLLVSILWKNLQNQLKKINLTLDELSLKFDNSKIDLFKTIETLKLRQIEQEVLINAIREHNSNLEAELAQISLNLNSLRQ